MDIVEELARLREQVKQRDRVIASYRTALRRLLEAKRGENVPERLKVPSTMRDPVVVAPNVPRGEAHKRARLTEAQVRRIKNSHLPSRSLARQFEVSEATISLIKSGKRWAHVR